MILILGQNPARSSATGEPFVGTRSGKRLFRLLKYADVKEYVLMNVVDFKTDDNRPLKRSELKEVAESAIFNKLISSYEGIITVGKQATEALALTLKYHNLSNVKHLEIPHTSPKNLVWNDWLTEVKVVSAIRKFINEA